MNLWEIPAFVLSLMVWLQSPPATLAEAAQREAVRRQMMPKATRSLTNDDVERLPRRPLPTAPEAPEAAGSPTPAAVEAAKKPEEAHDEPWWRERLTSARAALERDGLLLESLQSRVNALTTEWSARDDPGQRQLLLQQRTRVLAELENMKEQLIADQKAIDEIQGDARRQGVPPGWVR